MLFDQMLFDQMMTLLMVHCILYNMFILKLSKADLYKIKLFDTATKYYALHTSTK